MAVSITNPPFSASTTYTNPHILSSLLQFFTSFTQLTPPCHHRQIQITRARQSNRKDNKPAMHSDADVFLYFYYPFVSTPFRPVLELFFLFFWPADALRKVVPRQLSITKISFSFFVKKKSIYNSRVSLVPLDEILLYHQHGPGWTNPPTSKSFFLIWGNTRVLCLSASQKV